MTNKLATIDDVENYWDDRPSMLDMAPAPVGTKEYFDQVEKRKFFVEPHILRFTEFDRWRSKKVLEIGCGIGTAAQISLEVAQFIQGWSYQKIR